MNKIKRTIAGSLIGLSSLVMTNPSQADIPITNSLKNIETSQHIYVGEWDNVGDFLNYSTIEQAIASANLYEGSTKLWIGEGKFENTENVLLSIHPLEIEGQGNKTIINNLIFGYDKFDIKNIKTEGVSVKWGKEYFQGSFGFLKDGSLINSELTDMAVISLNVNYDFDLIGNKFSNLNNPAHNTAVYFEDEDKINLENNSQLNVRYNEFNNLPLGFKVIRGFQGGDIFVDGNNAFIDVDTVIHYNQGSNETVNLQGNYWSDTLANAKANGQTIDGIVYTNPEEILEKKVINESDGFVDVSNPLSYNPLIPQTEGEGEPNVEGEPNIEGEGETNPTHPWCGPRQEKSSPLEASLLFPAALAAGYVASRKKKQFNPGKK